MWESIEIAPKDVEIEIAPKDVLIECWVWEGGGALSMSGWPIICIRMLGADAFGGTATAWLVTLFAIHIGAQLRMLATYTGICIDGVAANRPGPLKTC